MGGMKKLNNVFALLQRKVYGNLFLFAFLVYQLFGSLSQCSVFAVLFIPLKKNIYSFVVVNAEALTVQTARLQTAEAF